MKTLLARLVRDERGVTAIEYGLIAALIAVVIIGAVGLVGTKSQHHVYRHCRRAPRRVSRNTSRS